jgi:hypothetical protein
MLRNEAECGLPFFIQALPDILNKNPENYLLTKLCTQCVEKSLCLLDISSWNWGIEITLKVHLLPYSGALTQLLKCSSELLLKTCVRELYSPMQHFSEILEQIFKSWLLAIKSGRVKLGEVLLLSESMTLIKCLVKNVQLTSDIENGNRETRNTFQQTLQNLRDEVLPLICRGDNTSKRLVDMYTEFLQRILHASY